MYPNARNLPCNILPDNELWCVSGEYNDNETKGGGILEWCYDYADARDIARHAVKNGCTNVSFHKYKE